MTRRSPLHHHHTRLGARFVDFGGWEMPVQYESVLSEHKAVRHSVGVFDVSHLGRLSVVGKGATDALSGLFCNDVRRFDPGRTHYTMLLDDDGGIVDDLVVWRWDDEDYWVMPNAANSDIVAESIRRAGGGSVDVADLRGTTVLLAVQGPDAPALLTEVLGEAPGRFRTARVGDVRMAGTGYTGERGGEVAVEADAATAIFEDLLAAGAVPCGLGSRDTLRLEAGLPLWGADIDRSVTPLEARLEFAVAWDHDFPGRPALARQRESGVTRALTGLVMQQRGIPRHGHDVRSGPSSGEVTSGNLSPVLETGVALAYLAPPVSDGAAAEVHIRDAWVPATVTRPPFHR